jgi:hypothetical protein
MWISDALDMPPLLHYRRCLNREGMVFEDRWFNIETGTVWRHVSGTNAIEAIVEPMLCPAGRGKFRETLIRSRWGRWQRALDQGAERHRRPERPRLMSGELWIPMVQANEICARARTRYLNEHPTAERTWVSTSIPFGDYPRDEAGWAHVSNLTDRLARLYWYVLWHPETDEVRLEGPRR